jgi:polysaccharide export outer membrane protein
MSKSLNMSQRRAFLIIVASLFFPSLFACAPAVRGPAPVPAADVKTREYRIQPGDQMDVKFFYNPELNESVTVRPDGRISLQLAHELQAEGLTPAELTQVIVQAYARELDKPEITVIMRSFAGQRVYVDGEVYKPNLVPLTPPMTVLQSISLAGGRKETARMNGVVVIRRGLEGKPTVFTVDLDRVIDGTDTGQDVSLMPFDVVFVPRSPIANVNLWVDQYIRKNLPVGFGAYYQINPSQ